MDITMTPEQLITAVKVVERADNLGLLAFDRLSLMMDLNVAFNQCKIDIDRLNNFDEFNFIHDVVGIQRHINRQTGLIEDHFIPRCAR